MHIDFSLSVAFAGLLVGFVVGLTGMGGGSLMTPIMIVVFKVSPLAAVSSDLMASLVMKPFGGAVHYRRGTINWSLVKWLMVGSVPSAFAGVLLLRAVGHSRNIQGVVQVALGAALLMSVATLVFKAILNLRSRARGEHLLPQSAEPVVVRPVPTVLIGVLGGLVVGMTSVGSGSLIIVLLLLLYPKLRASQLVGTDLVQAIPLVASATAGHLLFGDFQLSLTASLLVGAIPGVLAGARISSVAPGRVVRRALALVLLASGLKLVNVDNRSLFFAVGAVAILGPLAWALFKRLPGLDFHPSTAVASIQNPSSLTPLALPPSISGVRTPPG